MNHLNDIEKGLHTAATEPDILLLHTECNIGAHCHALLIDIKVM